MNITTANIHPENLAQNAYIEKFNRTYREDVPDRNMIDEVSQAQNLSDEW